MNGAVIVRRSLYGVAATAVIVIAALAIGVPVPIGDGLILHPPPRPDPSTWRRTDVEPFAVQARDGVALRGWIVPGRDDAPWVILNYGNATDSRGILPIAQSLNRSTGSTAVVWDYRGYGFSGGTISVGGTRADALAIAEAIRRRSKRAPIVYGLSFGTTIAASLSARTRVCGTILHAPPSDAQTEFRYVRDTFLPWPLRRLRPAPSRAISETFAVAATMGSVHTPLLVLHGDADQFIPASEGRSVEAAAAGTDKAFVAIPGAGHNDVFYDGTMAGRRIAEFIAQRHCATNG